jgi:hypothetical protein
MHTPHELDRRARAILDGVARAARESTLSDIEEARDQQMEDAELLAELLEGRRGLDQIDDEVLDRWDLAFGMSNIARLLSDAKPVPPGRLNGFPASPAGEPSGANLGSSDLRRHFWAQMQQCVAEAVSQAQDRQQVVNPIERVTDDSSLRIAGRSRVLTYTSIAALLAFAVSLSTIWLAAATWRVETGIRDELVALKQTLDRNDGANSIQVTSQDVDRTTAWREIWNNNVTAQDSDKRNLDRLRIPGVLPPELSKLILLLQAKGWNDADILSCLRILMTKT